MVKHMKDIILPSIFIVNIYIYSEISADVCLSDSMVHYVEIPMDILTADIKCKTKSKQKLSKKSKSHISSSKYLSDVLSFCVVPCF